MRMTRAALRAQEVEEELQAKIEDKLREQELSSSQSDAIFEDADQVEDPTLTEPADTPESGRLALRDITQENYPVADPAVVSEPETGLAEEPAVKAVKKAKSKKGKKASGKTKDTISVEEHHQQTKPEPEIANHQENAHSEPLNNSSSVEMKPDAADSFSNAGAPRDDPAPIEQVATECEEKTKESTEPDLDMEKTVGSRDEESSTPESPTPAVRPETPSKPSEAVAKTPRFNPAIHLPYQSDEILATSTAEDSFVESIKTRSPSKLSQSVTEPQTRSECDLSAETPIKATPQKTLVHLSPQSSQRIEDSVEAIDALEDAIEKFSEDLPVIEALPFESPVRSRKTPIRTPATRGAKILTGPPIGSTDRTPLRSAAKTSRASVNLVNSSSKTRTPSVSIVELQPNRNSAARATPARKETVRERVRAIESRPAPAAHRRVTSVNVAKKETSPVGQAPRPRHAATKSVPTIASSSTQSMSFSNSPAKQTANQPKKRVTSSGALSTSRPGFVPAKSTKPATSSTFALPGEAVAAKLKAQREARLKREETQGEKKAAFKARPAPARATRPSVMPRDNKASAARLGVRQASGENKENMAPAKPIPTPTTRPGTTAPTANTSVRRTTMAPKPTSVIESRKSDPSSSTDPDPSARRINSLSSGQPLALTKTEAAQQKVRGREVYSRIKGSIQQQEDERKAKEEAARKARAEAAEKGRQASREWAEKQKKKAAGTNRPALAETAA